MSAQGATGRVVAWLRREAATRTFGVADERRRRAIHHGYLLALEELERALDEPGTVTPLPSGFRHDAA